MSPLFTIVDAGGPSTVDATVDGERVLLTPRVLEMATGWTYRSEGLCREDVCVPVLDPGVEVEGLLDLGAVAATLRRPLARDIDESAAYLGASATQRAEELTSLRAPDFTLSDLDGKPHSLSDYRGKKVLLIVYASW